MNLTGKLLAAQVRQQRVRLTLTAIAMVAAIGVVLWVVSAYEAIASRFDDQTADFVGGYSAFVAPQSLDDAISPDLIAKLNDDPALEEVNPVAQFRMMFRRQGDQPVVPTVGRGLGRMGPTIVGTESSQPRYPLLDGRWLKPDATAEAVVSSGVAEALSIQPDDIIEFRTNVGDIVSLTVVGITEQVQDVEFAMSRTKGGAPGGTNRGSASLAAYVSMVVVKQLTGASPKINLLEIRTKPEANLTSLATEVAAAEPATDLIRPDDVRKKLSTGFAAEAARKQAYFVTALSILASAFIIFTTLSMGVNERARQLAVLRAVGLKRFQVARLVLIEAVALALFGWGGGLLGGWMLLKALASANPGVFPNGVSLGGISIVLTGFCSLAGSLLASIFPIWKAIHISPLEAMVPLQTTPRGENKYIGVGLVSLVLIALNPLLVYWPGLSESLRFILVLCVGTPTCVLGFVLLSPLCVLFVERVFSAVVAKALRLQVNLVRTQLSNNMWRSAGIAASLMLGLGLYTATQVWGWSMLGGFLPGRWTPNTIVKFDPGISDEVIDQVRQTEGVVTDQCFPIAVEQAKLVGDPLKSNERDSAVRQDNVTVIGIDTAEAFEKDFPAFQLQFVQGSRTEALARLKEGRHCLVPESFIKYAGMSVGDKIGLILPKSPEKSIDYTIVGIIAEPGSNWMTKTTGLRKNFVRTAGLVFAPREQVRVDFDLPKVEFFWLQMKSGVTTADLEERLKPLVPPPERGRRRPSSGANADRESGIAATSSPPPASASESGPPPRQPNAGRPPGGPPAGERPSGMPAQRPGGGRGRGAPFDPPIRVTSIDDVRDGLRTRGGTAVSAMGWLPLITLLVVSLGIVNTIAASVRARQWEFGILRAVGLKRFALAKLVLAEAILIGFAASVLSLSFGILTGWNCLGLVRYVSNPWFEGVSTSLVIPWAIIGYGYALTFVLCIAAALWPAVRASRTEPLQLLQGGRSAM